MLFYQPPLGPLLNEAEIAGVYTSFEDVPLDVLPGGYRDGDDSLLADGPLADDPPAIKAMMQRPLLPRNVVVPHPRDLKFGNAGLDVLALQRALSAAKLRPWGHFTRVFGTGVRKQVIQFQRQHNLKADGVYGQATHRALARYYDAYGIKLLNSVHILTPTQRRRKRLLSAAMIAYNYGGRIHYSQGPSRMWLVRHHIHQEALAHQTYIVEDCSSFATWLHWDAGVPDPNGLAYQGWGYTGTLADHGARIDPHNAPVGALFFYGWAPYTHVTISVGGNRCISQGGEYGPNLLSPFYRTPSTCHQYSGL